MFGFVGFVKYYWKACTAVGILIALYVAYLLGAQLTPPKVVTRTVTEEKVVHVQDTKQQVQVKEKVKYVYVKQKAEKHTEVTDHGITHITKTHTVSETDDKGKPKVTTDTTEITHIADKDKVTDTKTETEVASNTNLHETTVTDEQKTTDEKTTKKDETKEEVKPPSSSVEKSAPFGLAVNSNLRPMITYDAVRLYKYTVGPEIELSRQFNKITALGAHISADLKSDRYFVGVYGQYSFSSHGPEAGLMIGHRF